MKNFLLSIICLFLVFTFGCGHNVVNTDKGIGVHAKIPLPNGGSLVDLKLGYIDSTAAVIRGNTTVDASTASGGSGGLSFGGGTSQVVLIKSGPQLNQGYIAQVLTDPNVDTKTKSIIAQYLINCKQLKLKPTSLTVSNGGVTTGQNPKEAKSIKNGIDNVVDKMSDGYQTTVKETVYSTKTGLQNITDIIMKHITLISVGFFMIVFLIAVMILNKQFRKKI